MLGFCTLLFSIVAVFSVVQCQLSIPLAGMFYLTTNGKTDPTALSRKTAFMAGISDVNSNTRYNTALTLSATYYDTQQNPTLAAQDATSALNSGARVLVTALTSLETVSIANLNLNVPVLASGADAPVLSSAANYPLFLRDIPNGYAQANCLSLVIQRIGDGLGVAELYVEDDPSTSAIGEALFAALQNYTPTPAEVSILTGLPGNNVTNGVAFLRSTGAQIWPILAEPTDLSKLAAAFHSKGIPASGYIVVGPDSIVDTTALFTSANSIPALQNAFACPLSAPIGTKYNSFLTSYARQQATTGAVVVPEQKAVYTYDLVFMIAEAFLAVIQNGGDVTNANTVMAALRNVSFTGASGQIYFTPGSNDIPVAKAYDVQRVVNVSFETVGTLTATGVLHITDDTFTFPKTTGLATGSFSSKVSLHASVILLAMLFSILM